MKMVKYKIWLLRIKGRTIEQSMDGGMSWVLWFHDPSNIMGEFYDLENKDGELILYTSRGIYEYRGGIFMRLN